IDPRPVNRQFLAFLERIGRKPYEPKESLPGSWAGDRLICFGKYGDLPEGIITQREAKRLTEIAKTEAYLEKDPYGREHPECLLHARILDRSASKPLPLMPDYDLPTEHIDNPNIVWALRNLSKKEFVRSDGIPTYTRIGKYSNHLSYNHHKGYQGCPGLAQALFLRIRWSGNAELNKSYGDGSFPRGIWAGDRFDVRAYEDVAEEMAADGWIDSTRPLAREIYDMSKLHEDDTFIGEFKEEPGEGEMPYNSDDEVFSEEEFSEEDEFE
ncbi:hypothetical protein M413DRAFT_240281, partial [Hebeloma cylindrosporum]